MYVQRIGISELHNGKFAVDRTNFFDSYLLILLKSPAYFYVDDEWVYVPDNYAVLYEPNSIQKYKAAGNIYIDDWLHIVAEPSEMARYGILMNYPIQVKDTEKLRSLFRLIADEFYMSEYTYTEVVEHMLIALLLKLGQTTTNHMRDNMSLASLHEAIRRYPMKNWNIPDVAKEIGLSCSRFQVKYHKSFGITFGNDVINSRMNYAKELLEGTSLPIREISYRCGYQSDTYFSKQFKQINKMTPITYRKQFLN